MSKKQEEKKDSLFKKYPSVWESLTDEQNKEMFSFAESYTDFISYSKTERRAVEFSLKLAQSKGYTDFFKTPSIQAGSKVYFINRDKNILLFHVGQQDLEQGIKLIAAHLDAPRLDLKPNFLYEEGDLALLETHYYGGIKKYQWTTLPLALYGTLIKKNGEKLSIAIGDDPDDPIFYISDLLIHLSKDQLKKTLDEGVTGEDLNVLCGSMPYKKSENEKDEKGESPIKKNILMLLKEKYDITEEDLVGAEFEIVPAGMARKVGFDKSMIAGYGHDDRSCSFAALKAILDQKEVPKKTLAVLLVDKEEIGSYGNTGLESDFFTYALAEFMQKKEAQSHFLAIKRCLTKSFAISADVTAGMDPNYPGVEDKKNAAALNKGVCLKKYTGARGKSGASDASAEFFGAIRNLFTQNNIVWQTGELGKVDQGGGGTVAFLLARLNMDVLDMGMPVLSMHSPWEVIAKADLYTTYLAYKVFLEKFDFNH